MIRRAAIAAPNPTATQAGLDVLAQDGNALDAAIASMITASVTEPGIISPLGGCYINIWPEHGSPLVIDGNVEMPGRGADCGQLGRGLIECVTTYGGGLTTYVGPGSVATPGMIAAMGWAHRRYGTAPWAELCTPAVRAVTHGFPISRTVHTYSELVADNIFAWDPVTRAVYTRQGLPMQVGDQIRDPDLAAALQLIADDGASVAYTGELGHALADDVQQRGGLLTRADLAAYRPVARPALRARLGDWDLACNPAPSIGGPVLTAMLRLLGDRSPGLITVTECVTVMRAVLDLRVSRMDLAPDLEAAGTQLLAQIAAGSTQLLPTPASTAHVSVVDSAGVACAITASSGYGSGMTVAGTGMLANNALGEPELNRRGMHTLAPGTRMASNMAPTTARHCDGSMLAIGTPGADRITTALAQVLVHMCIHGGSMQEAIDRPRMHVRHLDDASVRIDYERDAELAASLADVGLPLHEHEPHDMFFGGIGGALRSGDGALSAGADPRRAAATAVS